MESMFLLYLKFFVINEKHSLVWHLRATVPLPSLSSDTPESRSEDSYILPYLKHVWATTTFSLEYPQDHATELTARTKYTEGSYQGLLLYYVLYAYVQIYVSSCTVHTYVEDKVSMEYLPLSLSTLIFIICVVTCVYVCICKYYSKCVAVRWQLMTRLPPSSMGSRNQTQVILFL